MNLRLERVREMLKRTLGEIIRRDFPPGDCGLITVNDVDVSADLKEAKVYVGVVGKADAKKRALKLLEAAQVDPKQLEAAVAAQQASYQALLKLAEPDPMMTAARSSVTGTGPERSTSPTS